MSEPWRWFIETEALVRRFFSYEILLFSFLYFSIFFSTLSDNLPSLLPFTSIYIYIYIYIVTWWLTELRRWEGYSLPVELKLSSSQKVTVRNDYGSHRCLHLSDLGSPDIGRGRRKWSQMIGGGTPNGSGVPFPSTGGNTKKDSFWATLVADGR